MVVVVPVQAPKGYTADINLRKGSGKAGAALPVMIKKTEVEEDDLRDKSYLGGQTRMEAAASIYKTNWSAKFLVVGGLSENCKTIEESKKTSDMAEYLVESCGQTIVCERINSLPCTKHNFIRIFTYWEKQGFEVKNKTIGILTNLFHLPRSFKFLSRALQEHPIEGNPTFVPIAAESIISQDEIYTTKYKEYLVTLNKEVEGMRALEGGSYKDGCLWRESEYERGKYEAYENIIKSQYVVLLSNDDKSFLETKGVQLSDV